jgi:hypothetical protein
VRSEYFPIPGDDWTELHATFRVDKPFPEGWFAYVNCAQPGARFAVDSFRLFEGDAAAAGRPATRPAEAPQNLFQDPSFEGESDAWRFDCPCEQHNLKRAYRRTNFLVARLLANMGVAAPTPILQRFSTPVEGAPEASVTRNGDFRFDADNDGMADEWSFSASAKSQAAGRREKLGGEDGAWCLRLSCPPPAPGAKPASNMLAQYDVPVRKGQWYRISFRARAEGLTADSVTMTITNLDGWRSLFEYQRFSPGPEWKSFVFEVQGGETVEKRTRLQIWYSGGGSLWLSDVQVAPIGDPTDGRWLEGLYLDTPEEWDDPYRFFRW